MALDAGTGSAGRASGQVLLVDTTRPSVARVYDYWLGGKDHFAADRNPVAWADAN